MKRNRKSITLNEHDVLVLINILDDAGETARELESLERWQGNLDSAEITRQCRIESEKLLKELENCLYGRE